MITLERLILFYRRQGLRPTLFRIAEALRRKLYCGRMYLYFCPLPLVAERAVSTISIEQTTTMQLIAAEDKATLLEVGSPVERASEMQKRFQAGSVLWLARVDECIAGYGWMLAGKTMEPYYFPLKLDDVHLYDFFVFPEFRGRGINVDMVDTILRALSGGEYRRAYIECAAWNSAQIRSLAKTLFQPFGVTTKLTMLGQTFVKWHSQSSS